MAVKTKAQLLAQVASLLADNSSGDISALDVRTCLNDIIDSASYGGKKVYKALLTQTGTDAPVATVLENTLSGTPVWSYVGVGDYNLTLAGEWTSQKTGVIPPQGGTLNIMPSLCLYEIVSTDVIKIQTAENDGSPINGNLNYSFITIEVYP